MHFRQKKGDGQGKEQGYFEEKRRGKRLLSKQGEQSDDQHKESGQDDAGPFPVIGGSIRRQPLIEARCILGER